MREHKRFIEKQHLLDELDDYLTRKGFENQENTGSLNSRSEESVDFGKSSRRVVYSDAQTKEVPLESTPDEPKEDDCLQILVDEIDLKFVTE